MTTANASKLNTFSSSSSSTERHSAKADLPALLTIGAILVVAVLIVGGVRGDFPINDDFVYMKSVKDFLQTGQLFLQGSTASCYLHILIGAASCALFGVNFEVLRCTELFLSLSAAVAAYYLFLELGLSRVKSVALTMAIVLNPYVFALSFTFMTDVTSQLFLTLYFLFSVKSLRNPERGNLTWLALLSLCASVAVRQSNAAFAAVNLVSFPFVSKKQRLVQALGVVLPVVLALLLTSLMKQDALCALVLQFNAVTMQGIIDDARVHPGNLISRIVTMTGQLSFYLSLFCMPAIVPLLLKEWKVKKAISKIAMLTSFAIVTWSLYTLVIVQTSLMPFNTNMVQLPWFNLPIFLGNRPLVILMDQKAQIGAWLTGFVAITGFITLTALTDSLLLSLRRMWKYKFSPVLSKTSRVALFASLVALVGLGATILQVTVRDMDRYYLMAFIPVLMAIAIYTRKLSNKSFVFCSILPLILTAAYTLIVQQDSMATHRAQAAAIRSLEAAGANPRDIDAGWQYDFMTDYSLFSKLSAEKGACEYPQKYRGKFHAFRFWPINGEEYLVAWSLIPDYELVSRHPFKSLFPGQVLALKRKK